MDHVKNSPAATAEEILAAARTTEPTPDNPRPYQPSLQEVTAAVPALAQLRAMQRSTEEDVVEVLGWRFVLPSPGVPSFFLAWMRQTDGKNARTFCFSLSHTGARAANGGRGATYWVGRDELKCTQLGLPAIDPIAMIIGQLPDDDERVEP